MEGFVPETKTDTFGFRDFGKICFGKIFFVSLFSEMHSIIGEHNGKIMKPKLEFY